MLKHTKYSLIRFGANLMRAYKKNARRIIVNALAVVLLISLGITFFCLIQESKADSTDISACIDYYDQAPKLCIKDRGTEFGQLEIPELEAFKLDQESGVLEFDQFNIPESAASANPSSHTEEVANEPTIDEPEENSELTPEENSELAISECTTPTEPEVQIVDPEATSPVDPIDIPFQTDPVGSTAEEAWKILKSYGYSDNVCAGMIGNFMVECGGYTFNLQYNIKGCGYGLAQWICERVTLLFEMYGYEPTLAQQLEYVKFEMEGIQFMPVEGNTYETFLNSTSPESAAVSFAKCFERCAWGTYEIRKGCARLAYNTFAN